MALNQPSPPSIGSVACVLGADRTTVTAALKPLQHRGLVTIGVDADDRRSRRLKLTRAGCTLLARAVPIWRRSHAEIDRLLARGGSDRLRDELRALI